MNGAKSEGGQVWWVPQNEAWLAEREADQNSHSSNLSRWRREVAVTIAQLAAYDGRCRVLLERSENDHAPVAVADLELRDNRLWLKERFDEGDIAALLSGHGVPPPWKVSNR